ncbi:hypothetical protein ACOSQ4_007296 [Xanthoceras sorbifolium]
MCVFMGYPPDMKGYRLYDIITKQFFISRDVIFHEDIFPFHTINSSASTLVNPFPELVLPIASLDTTNSADVSLDFDLPPLVASDLDLDDNLDSFDSHDSAVLAENLDSAALRRSSLVVKLPSYLQDFHCNLSCQNNLPFTAATVFDTLYPIRDFVSYDGLPSSHKFFMLNVSSYSEP